jgi:membrane-associated phospholipid phosphatase
MHRRPLLSAALCVALGGVLYLAATRVDFLRAADLRTLEGFMGLWTVPGAPYAGVLTRLFNPLPFVALSLGLLALAVIGGRARAGVAAFGAIAGASATTQLLKPLLATQREYPFGHYMVAESWPSGHTTAVMSFALALVIVTPIRWRPLAVAGGGLLTVATVYSILFLGSHYPSDVAGGFLVATAWACVATTLLAPEARPRLRALAGGPALGGVVLAGVGVLAILWRPSQAFSYAAANTTFVLGALALAAGALVLSGSVPVPRAVQRGPQPDSPPARG